MPGPESVHSPPPSPPPPRAGAVRASAFARWAWMTPLAFPFGWAAWASFLYVGLRVRQTRWVAAGAVYLLVVIGAIAAIAVDPNEEGGFGTGVGTVISLVLWAVAAIHAFVIRKEFVRRLELRARVEDHELDRRIAADLVASSPAEALRLGVGRPDLADAHDGGLVDVNHAPVRVLALLPGIGDGMAARIVATRGEVGGFSSVAELGMVMELPASTVEKLRPLVVFLPL